MTATNLAADYAEAMSSEALAVEAVLRGGADHSTLEGFDPEEYSTPALWYLDLMLGVEVFRSTYAVPAEAIIEMTRTVGGPACWITLDTRANDDALEVRVMWGSDEATRRVPVPRLYEQLCEQLLDLHDLT
jgi:hypothetical protein